MSSKKPAPAGSAAARSDLIGYAALLGESFGARIDLLQRVIQGSHYPSLGRYKERLLVKLMRDYIPRTFEVGTGFVLFPHEDTAPAGGPDHHDPLNQSAFAVSKQCDILVFDSTSLPPVFRDDDFVVIRPESVRAVIEVKGALNLPETTSMLDSFLDFGRKWRTTQLFYKSHHQNLTPAPRLLGVAWRIQTRRDGHPVTNPSRIRETIAGFYKSAVRTNELRGLPVLDSLFIYDECKIHRAISGTAPRGKNKFRDGWASLDGRFIRFSNGRPYRDKDSTISALLAALHWATGKDSFNRFFSHADETKNQELVPYPHWGFSTWLERDKDIRESSDMV